MGFDLHWVKRHEAQWEENKRAEYFRFNIWGMGWMLGLLSAADVLDYETRHTEFPNGPDEGEPGRAAHVEASDAVRSERSPKPGMVPAFKFNTNDGWVVFPVECEIIAKALRGLLAREGFIFGHPAREYEAEFKEPDARRLAEEFAAYCDSAVEHGGFEVW